MPDRYRSVTAEWVVPDMSVLLKWYVADEVGSTAALALRDTFGAGTIRLAVPQLAWYELANAFQNQAAIDADRVERHLTSLADAGLAVIAPDVASLARAIHLGRQTGLSTYDATFAVVAEAVGGTWVTADERAVRRLPADFPVESLHGWHARQGDPEG